METIKFDDFLKQQLESEDFKNGFEFEMTKLSSAIALLKAREAAGLTQRELSQKASVPQSTIVRIERGENTSFDTMNKLALALGKQLSVELV